MPLLNRAVAMFGVSGWGMVRGAAAAAGSSRRPAISLSSNLRPSPGGWAGERGGRAWQEPHGGGMMLAPPIFGAERCALRMEEGDLWRRAGGRGDGRRAFFGVGDATIHEERRLIQHSPEELFDVVSSVDLYARFLPWCEESTVLTRAEDGSGMEARLKVGFKGMSETYTSKVVMSRPALIEVECVDSQLFDTLSSTWRFQTGPTPGSCWLSFRVEFKFRSALYNQVASIFLDEVVKKMMAAFDSRCSNLQSRKGQSRIKSDQSGDKAPAKVALTSS